MALDVIRMSDGSLRCPECGKEKSKVYNSMSGLAKHRSAAHGIKGKSAMPAKKKGRKRGRKAKETVKVAIVTNFCSNCALPLIEIGAKTIKAGGRMNYCPNCGLALEKINSIVSAQKGA